MAAPISHVFLAIQVLSGPLAHKFNEQEFIIGTSFPDIRYLRCIERGETHFSGVTLQDVANEPCSFKAGMLFHSLVDEVREHYMHSNGFYEQLPSFRLISQSMKLAEDMIVLSLFDARQYRKYFDVILDKERAYVGVDDIKTWHNFLKNYLGGEPLVDEAIRTFSSLMLHDVPFYKRWMYACFYKKKIKSTVTRIIDDQSMREEILSFYKNFSNNIS